MRHALFLAVLLVPAAATAQEEPFAPGGNADIAIAIVGDFTLESAPGSDGETFPHDASPLVRIGDGVRFQEFGDREIAPALYHLDGFGEVLVDAEPDVRTFGTFSGSVDWIRLDPVEPMVEGDLYRLRLVSVTDAEVTIDDDLDQRFSVDFTAGPSVSDAPIAPTPSPVVIDMGPTPGSPWSGPSHNHRLETHVVVADADFGPHDTWLVFEVEEGGEAQADSAPNRWVDPNAFGSSETLIASWSYPAPQGDGRKCVQIGVEDAYGEFVTSDVVCADPVSQACADAGCSAANSPGASALGLLLAVGLGLRRRRD